MNEQWIKAIQHAKISRGPKVQTNTVNKKGIYIVGDVHGDWARINSFINKKNPEAVIIAGDVAYFWKHEPLTNKGKIKTNGTKVYWVPGNHENMDIVKSAKYPPGGIYEVDENVFMCAFGSTLTIDGKTFLFCGGADSIDKVWRIEGKSWWRNETIQNNEFYALPDPADVEIDIVISHTKPNYFHLTGIDDFRIHKYNDPSCKALDQVFQMYHPKMWFFGHFHLADKNVYQGCEWFALNCLGETYGWRKLDNLFLNEENEIKFVEIQERRREALRAENDRRKDPAYVPLSEWPDNLESNEDLDW